ncbi:hypothetical protein TWF694_010228 [Orbilia ellipsospora]|uniref:Uncharacterized protein n=1 Tax=Orbilia ellipsospora TaxID=2528407 RepID=A0AAV9XAE8_9PEZI
MQFSLITLATLALAPLAIMAAPAPEPMPLAEPIAFSDAETFHDIVKRQYCTTDANCGGKKCLCQACYGGPIQCFPVCCN